MFEGAEHLALLRQLSQIALQYLVVCCERIDFPGASFFSPVRMEFYRRSTAVANKANRFCQGYPERLPDRNALNANDGATDPRQTDGDIFAEPFIATSEI